MAVKLPTFWTSKPAIWFAQAKAQFAIRNILADDIKFYYVVAVLDQDTAQRILDLVHLLITSITASRIDLLVLLACPTRREP